MDGHASWKMTLLGLFSFSDYNHNTKNGTGMWLESEYIWVFDTKHLIHNKVITCCLCVEWMNEWLFNGLNKKGICEDIIVLTLYTGNILN